MGWFAVILLVAWAGGLAWAKRTQSRRIYRALWIVAAMVMFAIGLVL